MVARTITIMRLFGWEIKSSTALLRTPSLSFFVSFALPSTITQRTLSMRYQIERLSFPLGWCTQSTSARDIWYRRPQVVVKIESFVELATPEPFRWPWLTGAQQVWAGQGAGFKPVEGNYSFLAQGWRSPFWTAEWRATTTRPVSVLAPTPPNTPWLIVGRRSMKEKKKKWIYILIGCDIVRAYWLIEQQEHYPVSGMGWWPEGELWQLINLPVPNRC